MIFTKRTNTDNRLPEIFDAMLRTDWLGGQVDSGNNIRNNPAVNIVETTDNFIVEVAAPGKAKDEFVIALDNEILTISSEEKEEKNSAATDIKYTRKEFSYSSFKRTFSLPETVNSEQISANYENGILVITMPKREEAKVQAKRMIEIS